MPPHPHARPDVMAALREDRASVSFLEGTTAVYVKGNRAMSEDDVNRTLSDWMHWYRIYTSDADSVDQRQLADFTERFAEMVIGVGGARQADEILAVLDSAIRRSLESGSQVGSLYLAKASVLGMGIAESEERHELYVEAVAAASPGTADWMRAMLALARYRTDTSRYGDALKLCREIRRHISDATADFECGVLAEEGIARFTSFRQLRAAEESLAHACGSTWEDRAHDIQAVARWVASAYHYRARLADLDGDHAPALELYLRGAEFQRLCPQETYSTAFVHLRISEPLISMALFDDAQEHLNEAQRGFDNCRNKASGDQQAQLGSATLAAARGDIAKARGLIETVLEEARAKNYWRGELLALGFLLALESRALRAGRVLRHSWQILRTLRRGELARNGTILVLTRIPLLLPVAVRRMSRPQVRLRRLRRSRDPRPRLDRCPCPLHDRSAVAGSG
ncbi:hypothetical protein OG713_36215 [Streptomyces sp. NBC_00723]|uniref:hypothetical protein n=1 Tax=Streptomyces sp. NBC_00723 TaxID=2903673 RepID=UPI00386ACB26